MHKCKQKATLFENVLQNRDTGADGRVLRAKIILCNFLLVNLISIKTNMSDLSGGKNLKNHEGRAFL